MANLFLDIPVPAANGSGAAVDVSAMGKIKTFTIQGTMVGTITLEYSNVAAAPVDADFVPLMSFTTPGKKTVALAARFMRARVSQYQSGAANADVGSNDDGTSRVGLPVTAGDGLGASTDVSALGTFNTITVGGVFTGNVIIELSEDGVDWVQLFTFTRPAGKSKDFVTQFMRTRRQGVDPTAPGTPVVSVVAVNDSGGSSSSSASNCLIYKPGSGETGPVVFDSWGDLITRLATLRANANGSGCYIIGFDDSDTSPAVVPAGGPYDMTNVVWQGVNPDNTKPVVNISEGATFTQLRHFVHMDLVFVGATPPVTDFVSSGDSVLFEDTTVFATGTGPLFRQTGVGSVTARLLHGSTFDGGGVEVWDVAAAATVNVQGFDGAILQDDTISGIGGATLVNRYRASSASLSFAQAAFAGTIARTNDTEHRLNVRDSAGGLMVVNQLERLDSSGGPITATLPASGLESQGQIITLKKDSTDANVITVAPTGADVINGTTAFSAPGQAVSYRDNGAGEWDEVSSSSQAPELYSPPEKWDQQNVAGTQTDVDLTALVSTSFDTIKAIRPGSIVGLSTRFTEAITDATADAAVVTVTVNGAAGALAVSHSSGTNPSGGEATQAAGVDTFAAGDLIGIQITTLASFTPTTTDVEAWMDWELD